MILQVKTSRKWRKMTVVRGVSTVKTRVRTKSIPSGNLVLRHILPPAVWGGGRRREMGMQDSSLWWHLRQFSPARRTTEGQSPSPVTRGFLVNVLWASFTTSSPKAVGCRGESPPSQTTVGKLFEMYKTVLKLRSEAAQVVDGNAASTSIGKSNKNYGKGNE